MISKFILSTFVFLITSASWAFDASEFPLRPDPRLTPGMLCERADEYRYSQKIAYCDRDVSYDLKMLVFEKYRRLGYRLNASRREDYKIDHFIPLCAGGSNRPQNLWPQHVSLYTHTDPLEFLACEQLKKGKIKQERAVMLITRGKLNLREIPTIMRYLESRP